MIKLKCRVDFKRIDNIDFCTQKKKWKEAIVKMKTPCFKFNILFFNYVHNYGIYNLHLNFC